jgi:ATP-dependent Lon protease
MILDDLDRKLLHAFPGKVVRKDLVAPLKGEYQVPSYVLEFLLGRYCASSDPEIVASGLREVQRILSEHYVRSEQAPQVQSLIRQRGRYKLIDKVKVRLSPKEDRFWAELVQLRVSDASIPDEIVTRTPRLLLEGCWAQVEVAYVPENVVKGTLHPFVIERLSPIQVDAGTLEELGEKRRSFTADEWRRTIIRSLGLEPSAFTPRQIDLWLLRLVAYVEDNYNLVEFGPRGTGKSFAYREFSPYALLVSGGETSVANLFGANIGRSLRTGLVSQWDVIAFDEVGGLAKMSDPQQVQIFKDYMESGTYSRGRDPISAHASFVLEGNLDMEVDVALRTSHLFCPFPANIRNDRAFLDRVHAYLPGWQMPRMRTEMLTPHHGFIIDFLADLWRTSRGGSLAGEIDRWFSLGSALDRRDEKAVRRTASGLLKLVYPQVDVDEAGCRWALELALEMRRRVKEQLKRMGGLEYWQTAFSYTDKGGQERTVDVEERATSGFLDEAELRAGCVYVLGRDRSDRRPCIFRVEVELVPGTGRANLSGLRTRGANDMLHTAFDFVRSRLTELGISRAEQDRDLHVQVLNPMEASEPSGLGLGIFVAIVSALRGVAVHSGAVVLGDMTVQGTITAPDALGEMLLLARENGARIVFIPESAADQLLALPVGLLDHMDVQQFNTGPLLVQQVLRPAPSSSS